MSKYYYLIAGLPNIAFDDGKSPYSVAAFKEELDNYLSSSDKRLLKLLSIKIDNKNLLQQLKNPGYDFLSGGNLNLEEINELIDGIKQEQEDEKQYRNKNRKIPPYFEQYVRLYLKSEDTMTSQVAWEDRLQTYFYEYAMKNTNSFASSWFELNLYINNILAAMTCRKYKLEREKYIIGNTDTINKLRTSSARDFDLGDTVEYLSDVMKIAEESDLYQRERKIDRIKWDWLDEKTYSRVFDIESVLAYLLKIEILERWNTMDRAGGERAFRGIVKDMNRGSDNALEEFKRNNKK
jgi:hypothetical protein